MPKKNVANVDLTRASLTIRKTFDVTINATTDSLATAVDAATNETFLPFDEERYCLIRRVDGVTEVLTDDKFTFTNGGGTLQINNIGSDLSSNQAATLIATLVKTNPKSKVKRKERINTLIVDKSRVAGAGIGGTTLNNGLTHGSFPFGTRVEDKKISLNTPDVIKVLGIFESTNTSDPSSPKIILSAIDGQTGRTEDLIVGERMEGIQSGAVALLAEKLSDSQISIVYLNDNVFKTGETIDFKESNVNALANTIDEPSKNISSNFSFNSGQKKSIYDHAFLTRKTDADQPSKKIKIYFENAYFEAADEGDITTANSYNGLEYDGDVYVFSYPNNATNSYFKVNYNSLPTQRVYWDSPDEFYVVMWQDTVWTPVVNYSTYSDDDGIGHQMVYVNPTLIGDTLNIIGTIYEEGITKEILVKIK